MSEKHDDISMSSDIEDDSISNLVIDQMNITEIADYIDLNCHECTTTPWTTELLFPSSFNGEEFKDQNILRYIDSKNHKQTKKRSIESFKAYLDPTKYPSNEGYESSHFQTLSKDLCNASMSCGFNLVRNGTRQRKSSNSKMIRFVCTRYRKFRGNTRSMDNDQYNFRQHDYHNDNKYSRGRDGIHYQRKTWTKRAINLEHTCPFYFYVAFDSKGFFVVPGLGNKKNICIIINNIKVKLEISLNLEGNYQTIMKNLLLTWGVVNCLQHRSKQQYSKAVVTCCHCQL